MINYLVRRNDVEQFKSDIESYGHTLYTGEFPSVALYETEYVFKSPPFGASLMDIFEGSTVFLKEASEESYATYPLYEGDILDHYDRTKDMLIECDEKSLLIDIDTFSDIVSNQADMAISDVNNHLNMQASLEREDLVTAQGVADKLKGDFDFFPKLKKYMTLKEKVEKIEAEQERYKTETTEGLLSLLRSGSIEDTFIVRGNVYGALDDFVSLLPEENYTEMGVGEDRHKPTPPYKDINVIVLPRMQSFSIVQGNDFIEEYIVEGTIYDLEETEDNQTYINSSFQLKNFQIERGVLESPATELSGDFTQHSLCSVPDDISQEENGRIFRLINSAKEYGARYLEGPGMIFSSNEYIYKDDFYYFLTLLEKEVEDREPLAFSFHWNRNKTVFQEMMYILSRKGYKRIREVNENTSASNLLDDDSISSDSESTSIDTHLSILQNGEVQVGHALDWIYDTYNYLTVVPSESNMVFVWKRGTYSKLLSPLYNELPASNHYGVIVDEEE